MNLLFRILKMRALIHSYDLVKLFFRGFILLIITAILHLVLFKVLESVSWNESFWQTWQTFTTVGYGNRPAETVGGRWTTILFGTMGIAFLGVIISQAFDLKQDRRDRRRLGMMSNPIKDGVIIFNYPGEGRLLDLVKEIRHLNPNMGFCVVDEKIQELPPRIIQLDQIEFVRGEMLKEETYKKAALEQNNIIIIFPNQSGLPSSDGLTQLIVLKASKFMGKNTRLVYVQVDQENNWLFKGCPGTPVLESFEILAIVQEVTDKFSSVIVEKLFLNTTDANPNTVTPNRIIGWTWFEFQSSAIQTGRQTGIQINPFGLVKNDETFSCPPFDTLIEEGDLLSVITYPGFDWDEFEQKMIEYR